MGRALTLGGRHFVNRHYNQPKIGCDGGGIVAHETRPKRNAWGGRQGATNEGTKEKKTGTGPRP